MAGAAPSSRQKWQAMARVPKPRHSQDGGRAGLAASQLIGNSALGLRHQRRDDLVGLGTSRRSATRMCFLGSGAVLCCAGLGAEWPVAWTDVQPRCYRLGKLVLMDYMQWWVGSGERRVWSVVRASSTPRGIAHN